MIVRAAAWKSIRLGQITDRFKFDRLVYAALRFSQSQESAPKTLTKNDPVLRPQNNKPPQTRSLVPTVNPIRLVGG